MILSIHQPNYIPFIGYFYKMAQSDVFVYLDGVQLPRGKSYAAKNRIKTSNGEHFLRIPISTPSGKDKKVTYKEVEFANNKWKQKHLKTVRLNYSKAPYFDEIYNLFEQQILNNNNFSDLNINLIQAFSDYLSINTKRYKLTDILKSYGEKNYLIIDICGYFNAAKYLSGEGAKSYNDETMLKDHNIELVYSDYKPPIYKQLWGEFIPNLSIIDLLFNCGPNSKKILFGDNA